MEKFPVFDDEPVTLGAEAEARFGTGGENKDEADKDAPGALRPGTPWDVISD